jgi:hypothetical protein
MGDEYNEKNVFCPHIIHPKQHANGVLVPFWPRKRERS